jgi:hypothetical protein
MKPLLVSLVCAVVSLPCLVRAQQIDSSKDKGTYLGVLFSPVPEVLYDQVPDLPRGQGVVVTHILPDSPAAKSKLNRHDIVLQYDEDKVRDCEHFARLIQADKPERKVKLLVMRAGKPMNAEVTLTIGPILRIAKDNSAGTSNSTGDTTPKGTVKPTGPSSVSVTALPLGENKIKLTIEYYEEGRLQTASCSGEPKVIESEIDKLPNRVQALAKAALSRIRDLNLQTTIPTDKPPSDPKH